MAQTVRSLAPGEKPIGSAKGGGLMTNRGNIYYAPQTPATAKAASQRNVPFTPAPTPKSSGGGSTQRSSSPQQSSQPSAPSFQDYVDDAFNSTMDYLNKAESTVRGQLPGIEKDINSMYGDSVNTLGADRSQGERQLQEAQVGGEERKEDAITAARRLYGELSMGGQQRFGGASSAGEAYQALAGRELQRNNQQIGSDFSTFMGQIEGARTSIQEKYTLALQNLESQKNRMLSEARRDLDNKLLEIDRQKAMAREEKSNRKLQALQDMRNQVFQIKLATQQGQTNIDSIRQGLEQELGTFAQSQSQALSQGQGAYGSFNAGLNMNPETDLAMGGGQNSIASLPTGVRRDDEMNPMGAIYNPRPRVDDFSSFA